MTTRPRASPSSPGTTRWPRRHWSTGWCTTPSALLAAFEDQAEETEAASALGLLALVAGQDVEQDETAPGGSPGKWLLTG